MRKILFFLLAILSISIFAEDNFSVGIGIGKTLIAQEGNAITYNSTFSTNFNFSLCYKFNSKYFAELKYTTDTCKIGTFLVKHNFLKSFEETYAYKIYTTRIGLAKNHSSFFLGIPLINANKKTKAGIEIGYRYVNKIYKNLNYYSEFRYIYVEDIIRRVVNTFIVDIGLKFNF